MVYLTEALVARRGFFLLTSRYSVGTLGGDVGGTMLLFVRTYYVYMLSNKHRTTFYIGVTNNIVRRLHEHREGKNESFSKRYRLTDLVYLEVTNNVYSAIDREKQLKRWHRQWKLNLIRSVNPAMRDLAADIIPVDSETSSE